jgi:enamine deaminase RidA (YjgF/YER057c/UK114 family)
MRTFHIAIAFLAIAADTSAADPSIRSIEPSATTGTSRAVVVGNDLLVHTSQILPTDSSLNAEKQATQVLAALDEKLRSAVSSLHACAKLNVYAADEAAASAALAAIKREFTKKSSPKGPNPAVSVVLSRLPQAGALVAMDAVGISMVNEDTKVSLRSFGAEGRISGSEHMAILPPGRKIYVAGQAEKADDVKTATQKTMESLASTLKFLGRTNDDIVQLKCFVKPVTADSAKEVEAGLRAVLGNGELPPVVLVEWESSLPIEIELVAWGGPIEAGMPAVEYFTPPGMTTSPVYSRVARTASEETIYISGLFGVKGTTAKEETEELFAQLGEILTAAGSDFKHLAKATYYVASDDASSQLNALRPNYYDPQRPPAASKALVRGVGIKGKTTTLDMIAVPAK